MKKDTSNIVFGIQSVMETLESDQTTDRVYINKEMSVDKHREIHAKCKQHGVPVFKVPIEKLNRITRKNHQGVICYTSLIEYSSIENVITRCYEEGKDPFIIILDRITDVRNFGAICRSAECLGADGILIPAKGGAQINSDAIKTSSGAINHIPICRSIHFPSAVRELAEQGLSLFACSEKGHQELNEANLTGPVGLILGSEEDGIGQELLKHCENHVKITMKGKVESLNVSVAAGVLMYEVARQRNS